MGRYAPVDCKPWLVGLRKSNRRATVQRVVRDGLSQSPRPLARRFGSAQRRLSSRPSTRGSGGGTGAGPSGWSPTANARKNSRQGAAVPRACARFRGSHSTFRQDAGHLARLWFWERSTKPSCGLAGQALLANRACSDGGTRRFSQRAPSCQGHQQSSLRRSYRSCTWAVLPSRAIYIVNALSECSRNHGTFGGLLMFMGATFVMRSLTVHKHIPSSRMPRSNFSSLFPGLMHKIMVLCVHNNMCRGALTVLCMVVLSRAGETPVKPIAVWANQTQKSASLLGRDSPLFGATTIQ